MKTFQVLNGFCHWDATSKFPTVESTIGKFSNQIEFVEAPDYVFEGWGYDETQVGDARFIQPTAPEGFTYDAATGGFVENNPPVDDTATYDDLAAALDEVEAELAGSTGATA